MTETKKQYEGWEVEHLPPTFHYRIQIAQERGGIITLQGRVTMGFSRLINPDPKGKPVHQICYIVEGIQAKTRRRHLEYFTAEQFKARVKMDPG